MGESIRVGIVGLGVISGIHLRALETIDSVQVAALCDIDRARAEEAAREMGIDAQIYTDYSEMIEKADIDAVHILTPHYLHARMTIEALNAGKYVLCEKPLATSIKDARAMIAADTQRKLGVIFQNRYNAATIRLKEIIESGELGAVTAMRGIVTWKRDAAYYQSGPWRGKWATEGGGVLINQAIHTIDQMLYLGGPVVAVKGSISRDCLNDPYEVEDNAHAVFEMENGRRALFYASNSYGKDEPPLLEISFERGQISMIGDCLYQIDGDDRLPLITAERCDNGAKAVYGNSHRTQIADFYRCVKEKKPFWLDGEEAYPAIWAVLSVYESSKTGKWIAFER